MQFKATFEYNDKLFYYCLNNNMLVGVKNPMIVIFLDNDLKSAELKCIGLALSFNAKLFNVKKLPA